MSLDTVQFVDSIAASPTVRLNLNNEAPWAVTGVDFSPPALKQAWAGTLLADGERLTAAAYANRRLRLSLELITTSQDAAGAALQTLWRELDRPFNVLRYQPDGATKPVFFRTLRSMDNSLRDYPGGNGSLRTVEVEIVAEPFALGLKETLPQVTVNNDPAAASNGMFFDVTSPKGDVEAPLYLSVGPSVVASRLVGARQSVIAVRRRGTPSAAPFVLQAEAMTVGTDTAVQANNTAFSGAGSNWTRTTFATLATMQTRLQASVFPAVAGEDVRGTYRAFMRYRQSASAGSPMNARLQWGASNGAGPLINGDAVALVQNDAGSFGPLVKYADLGLVQFPADYAPGYDGPSGVQLGAEGVYLAVQAERTSGSTSLDVDLLLFVPADDRMLFVHWPTAAVPPADLVVDSDASAVYARNASGQVVTMPHPYLVGGTPMVSPGVTNRVYFLQDVGVESSTTDTNSAGDSISATTSITPYYWPRYLYTRPLAG